MNPAPWPDRNLVFLSHQISGDTGASATMQAHQSSIPAQLRLLRADLIPVSGVTVMRARYKCSVHSVSVSASSGRMPAKGKSPVRTILPRASMRSLAGQFAPPRCSETDAGRSAAFTSQVRLESAVKHTLAPQAITDVKVR